MKRMIRTATLVLIGYALGLALVVGAVSGCAGQLDKLQPQDKGKPLTQIGKLLTQTANSDPAKAVAGAAPYGEPVRWMLATAGSLLVTLDQSRRRRAHKEKAAKKASEVDQLKARVADLEATHPNPPPDTRADPSVNS